MEDLVTGINIIWDKVKNNINSFIDEQSKAATALAQADQEIEETKGSLPIEN